MDLEHLQHLIERGYTNSEISTAMGVSERKVKSVRKDSRLRKRDLYSGLSDDQLDEAVRDILRRHPNHGEKMVSSGLLSKNIHVQRDRVREAVRRVDPLGVEARRRLTLHRRRYVSPGPNSIWHVDGNHKLIRWRIVIHGGIDGFSRVPVFLKCATNNRATTMFAAFKAGVVEFGLPQRVRSDKGGENTLICNFMMNHPLRGPDRSPFLTGRSVHNQRIERFWRDLYTGCTGKFYNLFYKMEEMGVLSCAEEVDMAALHYVFLPILKDHLETFRQSFLHHKIRTEHNKSPLQLWQSSVDSGWHIDVINEEDLHNFVFPQPDLHNEHVHVPQGMQLTQDHEALLNNHFGLGLEELKEEEDQIHYFTAVKEFFEELNHEGQ